MSGVAVFLMGAGTLGVPRRHWDISFAGTPFAYEYPGAAWLMMALGSIAGLIAIAGGAAYLLITVYSVFLGRKIETPGFAHVRARDGAVPIVLRRVGRDGGPAHLHRGTDGSDRRGHIVHRVAAGDGQ